MASVKLTVVLINLSVAFAALPANFQSQTADAKREILWTKIQENAYTSATLPKEGPSPTESLKALWAPYLTHAFTNTGDEMEDGRKKLLHPLGTVAKIQLNIIPNSTYSGVFQSGALGFARLSWARFDYSNIMPG